jgi:hypothetical protein
LVWHYPKPSATRFCRPAELVHGKENAEVTKTEITTIGKRIKKLNPTTIIIING